MSEMALPSWIDDSIKRTAERLKEDLDEAGGVPDYVFSFLVDSFVELDTARAQARFEAKHAKAACAVAMREFRHRSELWQQERKLAERNERAFFWASAVAFIATIVAWVGWLR